MTISALLSSELLLMEKVRQSLEVFLVAHVQ